MSKELSIKNVESSFLALKANCELLTKQCSELTITDALSLKIASQQFSLLKAQMKEVEDYRVEIKAPGLDYCKQVDALAKTVYNPMETVLEAGRKKVLSYNKIEEEKALAETNRINAIKSKISKYSADAIAAFDACETEEDLFAKREEWIIKFPGVILSDDPRLPESFVDVWSEFIGDAVSMKKSLNDYCKQRRIEINTPAEADEMVSETIKEVIIAQNEAIETVLEYVAPKGITGKFVHEIVDENLVPRMFLMVNDSAIKKFIKENSDRFKDGMVDCGIKFTWEENVRFK